MAIDCTNRATHANHRCSPPVGILAPRAGGSGTGLLGSPVPMDDLRYDLVLFGATGFTGQLVAEYLALRLQPGSHRWALAGRDLEKLRRVRARLVEVAPGWADLPLHVADTADYASLTELAGRTRVLVNTVGPYETHGEPVVKACLDATTDYLDLTGEPQYWRRIVSTYHERAVAAGVLIVPCCGFDSIPADLGVLYAVQKLESSGPVEVDAYVASVGSASGGTWASAIGIMGDLRRSGAGLGQRGAGRGSRPRVHFSREVGRWVAPLPMIDPLVVSRSAELIGGPYGDGFRYRHYFQAKSLAQLAGLAAGAGVVLALAKVPALRDRLRALRASGTGPSPERRARSWFRVDIVARGDGRTVRARVRGGDPGYDETSKMLSEAALCLVEERDALPRRGGVLTPASAMGDALLRRLVAKNLVFETVPEHGSR